MADKAAKGQDSVSEPEIDNAEVESLGQAMLSGGYFGEVEEPKKGKSDDDIEEPDIESTDDEDLSGDTDEDEEQSETDAEEETDEEESEETEEDEEEEEEPGDGKKRPTESERLKQQTARAKRAEEELESLKQEMESLKGGQLVQAASGPDNPLAELTTEAAVLQGIANARTLRKWCRENPDGGTVRVTDADGKAREIEVSAEMARARLNDAEDILDVHGPAQLQLVKQMAELQRQTVEKNKEAKAIYPDLFDKSSEQHKQAQEYLQMLPGLRYFPDHMLALGDLLRGRKFREAKSKLNGKTPLKKGLKAAPSAPKTAGAKVPVSTSRQRRMSISQLADAGGDVDSLAASLKL